MKILDIDSLSYSEIKEEYIAKVRKIAESIHNLETSESFEIMEMQLRNIISKFYKIPIFSDYFQGLTIGDLILEVELIKLSSMTPEDIAKSKMNSKQAKEELEHIFDDWEEEESNQNVWTDVNLDDNMTDEIQKSVDDFIKTGKFIGE